MGNLPEEDGRWEFCSFRSFLFYFVFRGLALFLPLSICFFKKSAVMALAFDSSCKESDESGVLHTYSILHSAIQVGSQILLWSACEAHRHAYCCICVVSQAEVQRVHDFAT